MMKVNRWIVVAATACALAWSCGKEGIEVPDVPSGRLKSVSVVENEVVLPEWGTAELHFSVQDPGFAFDYDAASAGCQVRMFLSDGKVPSHFALQSVVPDGTAGSYVAILSDLGTVSCYASQVQLALVRRNAATGSESFVTSGTFTVRDEAGTYGTIIKTGLPTIYVDTEEGRGVYSKEEYVPGVLRIRGEGGYAGQDSLACSIRGRGNTTWTWPKKPYLLRLEGREHLLGLHKHKRWVLLANFMDRTLMRNLVAMKVSSMTSLAWTPSCVPVELVLDGRHLGSYLLIEQVRVDKHRVDINEMNPEDNSGEAVTGGYLLECDFHYDNPVQWVDSHGGTAQWGSASGIPFGVKYPDPDDLTPAQLNYIKGYVAEASSALYGNDFRDPENGYAKYLDVDSFIDYWIVFEVMGNHELGNPGSVFMHKDRGGKLVAGPCWDFDWGVLSYNTSPQARTGLVNGNAIWYARLFQDPAFKARVKARFQELLPQLQTIPAYIDETERFLQHSATLNFSMWNPAEDASQNGGRIINGDENLSFHDAVVRLRTIYEERLTVIPAHL